MIFHLNHTRPFYSNCMAEIFRNLWKLENVYHEKIENILFEEYLMYKKEPLTFAAKSLFKDLSLYEDYKKAINGK